MLVPDMNVASIGLEYLDERVRPRAVLVEQVAAHDGSAVRPEP
jgi:hypothetical protein